MSFIHKLIEENIFTGLCASAFYTFYSLQLKSFSSINATFIFFTTIIVYRFLQKKQIKQFIQIFLLVGIWFIPSVSHLYTYLIGGVLTFLYSRSLRSKWYLKSLIISLVWILLLDISFLRENLLLFLDAFLLVSLMCIPFDIRDYKRDKTNETLPIKFGLKTSYHSMLILILIICILRFLMGGWQIFVPTLIYLVLFIWKAYQGIFYRYKSSAHFYADGFFIFQLSFLLV